MLIFSHSIISSGYSKASTSEYLKNRAVFTVRSSLFYNLFVSRYHLHHRLQSEGLFDQEHDAEGDDHHKGREGGDGRVEVILYVAHHLDWEYIDARAGQEGRQRYVVKGVDHRHDRGRRDGGFDVWQDDMEEGIHLRRTQTAGCFLDREVEVREARGHHTHDVWDTEQGVADQKTRHHWKLQHIDNITEHDETEYDDRNQHR